MSYFEERACVCVCVCCGGGGGGGFGEVFFFSDLKHMMHKKKCLKNIF